MSNKCSELAIALIALGSLCVGVAVYLFDRGGGASFVPEVLAARLPIRSVFGVLSGSLPTFVHTFAFALLTVVVLRFPQKSAGLVCLGWAMIDGLFEFGQSDAVQRAIGPVFPHSFTSVWLLERTASYFALGTFDIADVCSIVLGAVGAYLLLLSRSFRSRGQDDASV